MTQYLLSVHHDENGPDLGDTPMRDGLRPGRRLQQGADGRRQLGLRRRARAPVDRATVVDATGTEVITTDGPYTETKEYMGGFWVVEAPDLDAALEIARRGSAACLGPVEVRPFQSE